MKMLKSDAYFSADRLHRYWLLRVWDEYLPVCANIGFNPSKADEIRNDNTVSKDIEFARRLGYGALLKLNVHAFRSTDPGALFECADPTGPENTPRDLLRYCVDSHASIVIATWGMLADGVVHWQKHLSEIMNIFPELHCFGRTKSGAPRHTSRIAYSTQLEKFK